MSAAAGKRLAAIETKRRERRLSQNSLASAAGITREWYGLIIKKPSRASDRLIGRLESAVAPLHWKQPTALSVTWTVTLGFVARAVNLDPDAVRAIVPQRCATADPAWSAAAHARHIAAYALNQAFNIPQRAIAEVSGVSASSLCQAFRKLEDKRESPEFDGLLAGILRTVGGGQWA